MRAKAMLYLHRQGVLYAQLGRLGHAGHRYLHAEVSVTLHGGENLTPDI